MTLEELKYPIGKFEKPTTITKEILSKWIDAISAFPTKLKKEVNHLTDAQLDTQYRPGGWTIRQVTSLCRQPHEQSDPFKISFNRRPTYNKTLL